MQTINEHYHFQTENDVYNFLKTLGEKSWGLVLQTPSGHGFRLYNGEEELRNLAQHWFRFTGMFPYSEKLPSMDLIYEWASEDTSPASVPFVMMRLDEIYAVFSAPCVTGAESQEVREPMPYYIWNGKLICCIECPKTEQLNIPYDVTEIGPQAFTDCTEPVHVVLHSGIHTVAEDAFYFSDWSYMDSNLTFIEVQSDQTVFLGEPCNIIYYGDHPDTRLINIIAPENSPAWNFAEEHGHGFSQDFSTAVFEFAAIESEFEEVRDEQADFSETELYMRRAERALCYGMKVDPANISGYVYDFCIAAFNINSKIKCGFFDTEEAVKLLVKYGDVESYFRNEALDSEGRGAALVRTILALKKKYYRYPERALMGLDPESVRDYIEALGYDTDYNSGGYHIFGSWSENVYKEEDYFALGQELVNLFCSNRIAGWEEILKAAQELVEEVEEDEKRYGYFSPEFMALWE